MELQHLAENCQLSAVKKVIILLNLFNLFGAIWLIPAPQSVRRNEEVWVHVIECH